MVGGHDTVNHKVPTCDLPCDRGTAVFSPRAEQSAHSRSRLVQAVANLSIANLVTQRGQSKQNDSPAGICFQSRSTQYLTSGLHTRQEPSGQVGDDWVKEECRRKGKGVTGVPVVVEHCAEDGSEDTLPRGNVFTGLVQHLTDGGQLVV